MDYKGQTTVLPTIFILVGIMFLVPATTEKALAGIHATASGTRGPSGDTKPCVFTWVSQKLDKGQWITEPTKSGTLVTWATKGETVVGGSEIGNVVYKVGADHIAGEARLNFENPMFGSNKCSVEIVSGAPNILGNCHAGSGMQASFTYNLLSTVK
jgi:hypothetical protein